MNRAAALAVLVLAFAIAGCGGSSQKPAFQLTDVTGADFARNFQLTDHNGKPSTLADFKGKVVVVFFGFIQCPDACPTTMAELARVVKELGADRDKVQVLFITVDPERDTPDVLSRYVAAFDSTFLGLYGDAAATQRTAKEFKIVYQKQTLPGGGYTVDHSAGSYIFDAAGRLRLFARYGQDGRSLLHDIRLLLQGA